MAQLTPQQQAQLAQQMAMQQQMQAQQMVQMPNPVSGAMVMTGLADGGAVAVEAGVAQAGAAESAGAKADGPLDSAADPWLPTDAGALDARIQVSEALEGRGCV